MIDVDKIIPDTMIMRELSARERDEVCNKLAFVIVKSVYNSGRGSKRLDSSKVDF